MVHKSVKTGKKLFMAKKSSYYSLSLFAEMVSLACWSNCIGKGLQSKRLSLGFVVFKNRLYAESPKITRQKNFPYIIAFSAIVPLISKKLFPAALYPS